MCTDINFFYCPTATQTFSVLNSAQASTNGAQATLSFGVNNADTLLDNPVNASDAAFSGLGGPTGSTPLTFDFGLPFFFGRNVFTAIEGRSTPGGAGPYVAY